MNIINPDFSQPICRVCLQNRNEDEMISIFHLDNDINQLHVYEKIEQCAGIKILRHENITTVICNDCYGILKVSYKFRIICRNANEYLKECVVKEQIQHQTIETTPEKNPLSLAENVNNVKASKNMPFERWQEEKESAIATVAQTNKIDNDEECLNAPKDDGNELVLEDIIDDNMWFDHDDDNDENFEISLKGLDSDNKKEVESDEDMEIRKKQKRKKKTDVEKKKKPKKTLSIASDGTAIVREGKVGNKKEKSKKQQHICDICGNIYRGRYGLEQHLKRHCDEKPFGCEICPQAFYSNFELKRHMRKHTGLRPYKCSYCPRAFGDQSTLIKHERVHRNERPFKCVTCGKSFAYTGVLNCHKLTHTGEKPFSCELCGKCFSFAYHLRAHLLTQQHASDPRSKILLQNIKKNNDL